MVWNCLSLISWRVSFPWWIVLASLLEIRWPHLCGSLSGFSITKSIFPAPCQLQALSVTLLSRSPYLWPQIPSSHLYGPALKQRFEGCPLQISRACFCFFLSPGSHTNFSHFCFPKLRFCLFTSRWLLVLHGFLSCTMPWGFLLGNSVMQGSVTPHSFLFSQEWKPICGQMSSV